MKIPSGWITVNEAMELVPDVTRRRIQALAQLGRVRSEKVLGRLLLHRDSLIEWRDGGRRQGWPKGRSRKAKPRGKKNRAE